MAQDPDPDHLDLVEMVRKISDSSDQTYGERRTSRALKALGYEAGIWVRYRKNYRVTTNLRGGYQLNRPGNPGCVPWLKKWFLLLV